MMNDRIAADDIPRNWTFENEAVAHGFDRHVREQLPWYDLATGAVAHVARHYIPDGGRVYDIGASTGNVGRALAQTIADRKDVEFIPIEPSAEMCAKYAGPGTVVCADAMKHEFQPYDCAILFLVMMFMPVERRGSWLRDLMTKMRPGGCTIVFDKFQPPSGYVGTILRRLTLAGKVSAGIDPKEIVAKELSLGGVQRPLNVHVLNNCQHRAHNVFTFGEFGGYIFERDEAGGP